MNKFEKQWSGEQLVNCPRCGGSGQINGDTCPKCNGTGTVNQLND